MLIFELTIQRLIAIFNLKGFLVNLILVLHRLTTMAAILLSIFHNYYDNQYIVLLI